MKIIINGNTMYEMVKYKIFNNKKEIVAATASSSELTVTEDDIRVFDKVLSNIKKNKSVYLKLVLLLAISIDKGTLSVLAESSNLGGRLEILSDTIIGTLITVAKFGFMGMGLKEMIISLIDGGNIREASYAGLQHWLGYIFLQFYPYLYDLVEGLVF